MSASTRRRLAALAASALALGAGGCGGEDESGERGSPDAAGQRAATIDQILRDPANWDEGIVRVPGEAYPAGDRGFVLRGSGRTIWVAAPAGTDGIDPGERVTVAGEVERLTEANADRVDQALRDPTEPGAPPPPGDVVQETPVETGEPFIVLRQLSGEGQDG
jgi:hypothetical protein